MSAPSYASVAKEDERVEGVEVKSDVEKVNDKAPVVDASEKASSSDKTSSDKTSDKPAEDKTDPSSASSAASTPASLTPAPPPKVNAWKIKSDTVAVAPPSFEDKRETSPVAPKMKMGKGEKWVPYTPTLVMNGGKRGGRSKGASSQGGHPQGANGGPGQQQGQAQNRRKAKPRAPHGDKKDGSASENAGSSVSNTGGSGSDASTEGTSSEKRKMRYNYRKNYYKNDFTPGNGGGAPGQQGFYQPPGAYEYALSLIIGQVEYYFSVENLCKDLFMRKQMNSQGLVPLTLIAGFNRVKALAHDPAVFMQACRFAPSLQVVGDRIRLAQGWEQWVLPLEEREDAGKVEDVDPEAEAFPGLQQVPQVPQVPPQGAQQQQQQVQQSEPAKVSFDVANATPFVPKKQ